MALAIVFSEILAGSLLGPYVFSWWFLGGKGSLQISRRRACPPATPEALVTLVTPVSPSDSGDDSFGDFGDSGGRVDGPVATHYERGVTDEASEGASSGRAVRQLYTSVAHSVHDRRKQKSPCASSYRPTVSMRPGALTTR